MGLAGREDKKKEQERKGERDIKELERKKQGEQGARVYMPSHLATQAARVTVKVRYIEVIEEKCPETKGII